jgi:hypothetical protein
MSTTQNQSQEKAAKSDPATPGGLLDNPPKLEPDPEHPAPPFLAFVFPDLKLGKEFICVSHPAKAKVGQKSHETPWINYTAGDRTFIKWTRKKRKWKSRSDADPFPEKDWYFCVSSIDGGKGDKGTMVRRARAHLVRQHVLVLDDVGTKAKKPNVPPAWKMETSKNNYQYGYRIKPFTDIPTYEAIVDLLGEHGYGDEGAGGSYRMMRLPMSVNMKPERNRFKSQVEYDDEEAIWDLMELAEALGLNRAEIAARAAKIKSKEQGVASSTATEINGETLDSVLDWLISAGHVRGETDGKGWVSIQCPWGGQHTTGSDTASYSPLGIGGKYENNRVFNCLHAHCKDRDTNEFLEWIGEQGGPKVDKYDPLPVVQGNYVLIERGPQVLDLRERRAGREPLRDLTEFSTANYFKVSVPWREKRVLVKTAFLEDFDTTRCKALTYVPTAEDTPLITAADGALLANMFLPPQWLDTNTEPTVFLNHIDYLLPDPIERDFFMGWLAHKIQNPAERGVGVVMIAEDTYGVGRSWLGSLLDKTLPGEVRRTDIKQLAGGNSGGAATYNDIYANKQIVVVDETQADDVKVQYKAYENLKLVVDTSPSKLRVNPKYGKVYDAELLFNLLAFSNNLDALPIPVGDRRFCIMSNPTKPRDQDYYTRLYAALDDTGFLAAVYWHLRRYGWKGINPRVPLVTKARETMIEVTKSPSAQITEALRDDETMPCLMTRDDLARRVRVEVSKVSMSTQSRENVIAHIEKRLWASMHDAPWRLDEEDKRFRPRITGKKTHIKAWRVDTEWPNEGADWAEILAQNVMGSGPSTFPNLDQEKK